MFITQLQLKNFKSFRECTVDFRPFDVLIGANASGKSNFIQAFAFLRDVSRHGLADAASIHGGAHYLPNTQIGGREPITLGLRTGPRPLYRHVSQDTGSFISISTYSVDYTFSFSLDAPDRATALTDRATITLNWDRVDPGSQKSTDLGATTVEIKCDSGQVTFSGSPPEDVSLPDVMLTPHTAELKLPSGSVLLETPFLFPPVLMGEQLMHGLAIYDLDPKHAKRAVPMAGKRELEEDGSNLAIAITRVLREEESRKQFVNLVNAILPFVDRFQIESLLDSSMLLKLRETYANEQYLPSSLLSDGTINVIALILALKFESKKLLVFEEPERHLHPHLIARVLAMMRESAQDTQVLVSTHNPELLRHCQPNELLLASRDSSGFSCISRPDEDSRLRTFLANEIGLDELYVQNLLGMPK